MSSASTLQIPDSSMENPRPNTAVQLTKKTILNTPIHSLNQKRLFKTRV